MGLWLNFKNESLENLYRQIVLSQAAEDIARPRQKAQQMANTGAKGFAAVMKAQAEKMRVEFSKLADEVNSEFEVMNGHLQTGREQVQQLKSDNAELRDAFGFENDINET